MSPWEKQWSTNGRIICAATNAVAILLDWMHSCKKNQKRRRWEKKYCKKHICCGGHVIKYIVYFVASTVHNKKYPLPQLTGFMGLPAGYLKKSLEELRRVLDNAIWCVTFLGGYGSLRIIEVRFQGLSETSLLFWNSCTWRRICRIWQLWGTDVFS